MGPYSETALDHREPVRDGLAPIVQEQLKGIFFAERILGRELGAALADAAKTLEHPGCSPGSPGGAARSGYRAARPGNRAGRSASRVGRSGSRAARSEIATGCRSRGRA